MPPSRRRADGDWPDPEPGAPRGLALNRDRRRAAPNVGMSCLSQGSLPCRLEGAPGRNLPLPQPRGPMRQLSIFQLGVGGVV